ncbi:MAG: esterase/lipase family protein [Planctomycetota bacterium]
MVAHWNSFFRTIIAWVCLMHGNAWAQIQSDEEDSLGKWNLALPTLGGKQLWTDHRYWYGWRVQYSNTLGHWRLIDPKSVRRAWGTKQEVIDALSRIQRESDSNADSPTEVVILLHGLMRTSACMKPLATEIRERCDPAPEVVSFNYASSRDSVAAHAAAFREMMEHLPGKPRWKAVGHSLGNIVLRLAISQWQAEGDPHGILDRLDRTVMLGPPNQGSSFAKKLSQLGLFEIVTGTSGMQLGPQWNHFQASLGVPPCPFCVIAGDISQQRIQNPWLHGPNDSIVTVEEAKLEGMEEFITHPVFHAFLMQDSRCVRDAIDFLYP